MKKGLLIVCLIGSALLAFGGPPGGAPPRHGGPGPRHHRHGGDGVRLAADITAIVANSLGILNELAAPRSFCVAPAAPCVTTPVYVQPVPVYAEPVCPVPVYRVPGGRPSAPPPARWYYAPPRRFAPRCPR